MHASSGLSLTFMRRTLSLIFLLSGVSALVFETLWFRLVGLSLGNSVWSASLVLSAFMGGMAIGNVLTARLGNRISRPILLYVALELTIGIVGATLVFDWKVAGYEGDSFFKYGAVILASIIVFFETGAVLFKETIKEMILSVPLDQTVLHLSSICSSCWGW